MSTDTATVFTMQRSIIVKTAYEALHCWKDAPDEVSFLRDMHRHRFLVTVELPVSHGDRELEYFMVQSRVKQFCELRFQGKQLFDSCEKMAETIGQFCVRCFSVLSCIVDVSEDGENGSRVWVRR